MAYDGSVIYMINAATMTFSGVSMKHGKAMWDGGAIYATGTGVSSINFNTCGGNIQQYFESVNNGGFIYADNSQLTVTSSNCNWNHLYANDMGGFVYGNQI
jgi:hypothetical protein